MQVISKNEKYPITLEIGRCFQILQAKQNLLLCGGSSKIMRKASRARFCQGAAEFAARCWALLKGRLPFYSRKSHFKDDAIYLYLSYMGFLRFNWLSSFKSPESEDTKACVLGACCSQQLALHACKRAGCCICQTADCRRPSLLSEG